MSSHVSRRETNQLMGVDRFNLGWIWKWVERQKGVTCDKGATIQVTVLEPGSTPKNRIVRWY
jgi:hypothetical protein